MALGNHQSKPDRAAARDAWHAHCDGELPKAAQDAHVAQCPACRAYIASMGAIVGALADLRSATQPIGASLTRRPRRASGWWMQGVGRMAAAIALLLGAGAITYLAAVDAPPGPSLAPIAQHAATPDGLSDESSVQVALINGSADRFIPVAQPTRQPNVHVFVLFERP